MGEILAVQAAQESESPSEHRMRWGRKTDCKSGQAGSTPARASNIYEGSAL